MNASAEISRIVLATPRLKKGQLVNGINVDGIVEIFEDLGYECQVNSEVTGMSGVKHPFDIVAKKDSELVVADIVSFRASILDTPASDSEVLERVQMAGIRIRAKGWDCDAYQSFVICLSSYFSDVNEQGSKYDPFELFLKQNDIKVVRSADIQGASEKIRTLLGMVELEIASG